MKGVRFFLLAFFCSAISQIVCASNVEVAVAPDPDDKPLDIRIWYPNAAVTPDEVKGELLPLIVISHGTGGSREGHEDTARALADAGFVVVAMAHTGDNYRDHSYVHRATHLQERPRRVIRVIDYMLTTWRTRRQIDPERVGIFGHSAGGFTALVLVGGQPDTTLTIDHCRRHPQAWTCVYLRKNGVDIESISALAPAVWLHDPRIKAAVLAAPAVGYSFEPGGLAGVRIPIQLWSAERDQVVDNSAKVVRGLLPVAPEYHAIANAGHYAFLTPCNWGMRSIITVMTWFGTEPICNDPDGFDRALFHQDFNAQVVRFFSKALR